MDDIIRSEVEALSIGKWAKIKKLKERRHREVRQLV